MVVAVGNTNGDNRAVLDIVLKLTRLLKILVVIIVWAVAQVDHALVSRTAQRAVGHVKLVYVRTVNQHIDEGLERLSHVRADRSRQLFERKSGVNEDVIVSAADRCQQLHEL